MNFLLISRDIRTDKLFRGSWKQLLESEGCSYATFYMGVGVLEKIRNLNKLRTETKNFTNVIAFGLVESIFLRLSTRGNHFYVFTGLGRSWSNLFGRTIVCLVLIMFFRKQRIAVLNHADYGVLLKCGCKNITRLHGEGHPELNKFSKANIECTASPQRLRFVYVGRLLKSKGVVDVLELLAGYSEAGMKLKFTCIGDQDFNNGDSISLDEFEKYRSKIGECEMISFQSEPWSAIPSDAIYVSASKREGLSFSVLEALYRGHFCVLSDVPGHREFFVMKGVTNLADVQQASVLRKYFAEWNELAHSEKLSLRFQSLKCYSLMNTMDEKKEFLRSI